MSTNTNQDGDKEGWGERPAPTPIDLRKNNVQMILDQEGRDICSFEKFSLAIDSPDETYEKLEAFAENLKER